ncbi:MAG: NAD(P)H-dependent oxidoreductase subunit E [Thermoplasmatota archaeon]
MRFKPQIPKPYDARADLDDIDRTIVDKILQIHGKNKESLIAIMQSINEQYHYLPKHVLKYVSQELKIPVSQIYQVATFYTTFSLKPRGKHLIKVCMGTACHVRGSPRVLDEIQRHLNIKAGETTEDGLFTLETVNCLGACAIGPVVVIDDTYYMIKPGEFAQILKKATDKEVLPVVSEVKK